MKVKNWSRKVASTLLAAGLWLPNTASALDIPLGDPSFEAFALPQAGPTAHYAYANTYRPTSAWVGNPDGSGPLDGGPNASNWLYDGAYTATTQPAPRTALQAMHGRGFYSGQEAAAVFEAGKTYTFSVYAQGDDNAALANIDDGMGGTRTSWDSRVFLYIYDGSLPFSEPNSLTFARYSPAGDSFNQNDFVNRAVGWDDAQSATEWRQISLEWTVQPGAPEIGHPVGVAFWAARDAGIDDATLTVVPEPSTVMLVGAAGLSVLALRRRKS
jgi:hypothetical protein